MDLTLTPEEQAFRDELRAWLEENHPGPAPTGGDAAQFEFEREWQRTLHAAGWAGVSWPKEYGGRGATLIEQSIFGQELARAKAPRPANVLGFVMGGPVVIAHGTEEQKERFLEPILSAEESWCQGFSEPESGSDLASLKTRAVSEDGGWRITGQKVWTTFAHEAKWCMLLARSDPDVPKHKGLTYFILDMEQDAVDVRPLRQITAEALRLGGLRTLTQTMRTGIPGPEGSLAKWQWADANQALTELATEVLGPEGLERNGWSYRFLRARANSIEGGTTEVMKNIIAERVLGLPRLR